MTQWALEHPILSTILVIFALTIVHDTIVNVAYALRKKEADK